MSAEDLHALPGRGVAHPPSSENVRTDVPNAFKSSCLGNCKQPSARVSDA